MRSNMTDHFKQVPHINCPRSVFNMFPKITTTIDCDYLYPILAEEVLPADTFEVKLDAFARINTPIFPIMDNLLMETFFFEVPTRIVWENWRKFQGERYPDPDSSIDYTVPQFAAYQPAQSSLSDYFGLPTANQLGNNIQHNSLFHRSYNMIWNEWFRDQNLQDSVVVDVDDGDDAIANYVLLKANKRHDYFTSALPWPQKGDAVNLPLGTTANIHTAASEGNQLGIYSDGSTGYRNLDPSSPVSVSAGTTNAETNKLYADLSNATSATINQLREAYQIQSLLERDARGGTRYIEIIKAHFNVTSPDGRAWRPVYLGGGKSYVNISPIAQTSATDATVSPQGNLAAMGTAVLNNHGFTKSFTEHSIIIGLICVRPDLTYFQGVSRKFTRQTRYDYAMPVLANLGEQPILNKEIFANGDANDDLVFGYTPRYEEYRFMPSMVTSLMRPDATGTLAAWMLTEDFGALPTLGDTFIQSNTPMDRVVAVTDEPDFLLNVEYEIKATRPLPLNGVPASLGRF